MRGGSTRPGDFNDDQRVYATDAGSGRPFWASNPLLEPENGPVHFRRTKQIHIINLEKTQPLYAQASAFIKGGCRGSGKILFVGTKRSARDAVQKEAARCNMPYVNQRWLGGMLTNFKTIRQSIKTVERIGRNGAERFPRPPRQERGADAAPLKWTNCCAAWAASVT